MQGYFGRRGRRVRRPAPASLDTLRSGMGSLGDTPATAPIATSSTPPAAPAANPPAPFSLSDTLNSPNVSTAAAIAMGYHGYKRTESIFWALIYALAGKEFPIETVPLALAQGFGQKKKCT